MEVDGAAADHSELGQHQAGDTTWQEPGGSTAPQTAQAADEYTHLWATVNADTSNFASWVALIRHAVTVADVAKVRQVFDNFLQLFPLCYGYWQQYVNAEVQYGDQARAVLERAVASAPYSVELWLYYAQWLKQQDATVDEQRTLLQRAAQYLSLDWNAGKLFDRWVDLEKEHGDLPKVISIYASAVACPMRDLERYHAAFHELAMRHTLPELVDQSVVDSVTAQAVERKRAAAVQPQADPSAAAPGAVQADAAAPDEKRTEDDAGAASLEDASAQANAGVSLNDSSAHAPAADQSAPAGGGAAAEAAAGTGQQAAEQQTETPEAAPDAAYTEQANESGDVAMQTSEAAEAADAAKRKAGDAEASEGVDVQVDAQELRAFWLQSHEGNYASAWQTREMAAPFEASLRRRWWHHKPLDPVELRAWWRMLDAYEAACPEHATYACYERCLVPCANYPEYWCRYIVFLQKCKLLTGLDDIIKYAIARASGTFCARRPDMLLFCALKYEADGELDSARGLFAALRHTAPSLAEGAIRWLNFQRRNAEPQEAAQACVQLVHELRDSQQAGSAVQLALQYATVDLAHGSSASAGNSSRRDHAAGAESENAVADVDGAAAMEADDSEKPSASSGQAALRPTTGLALLQSLVSSTPSDMALWRGLIACTERAYLGPERASKLLQMYKEALGASWQPQGDNGVTEGGVRDVQRPPALMLSDREVLAAGAVAAMDAYGSVKQLWEAQQLVLSLHGEVLDSNSRGAKQEEFGGMQDANQHASMPASYDPQTMQPYYNYDGYDYSAYYQQQGYYNYGY